MGALSLDRPEGDAPFPPGFVHLPDDVTEDQIKQLTAEELVTRVSKGRTVREWSLIAGRRNEVLDCAVYARALAQMRGWDRWRDAQWRELEASLGIEGADLAQKQPTPADLPPPLIAGAVGNGSLTRPGGRSRTVRSSMVR